MEKTFNIKVEEFKQELFKLANNSNLPFSSVYYILKDFMQEAENTYNEVLSNEYRQYQEENENKEEIMNENENVISD